MNTHSCGARWTGHSAAHCASYHRTFTSDTAFDMHRVGLVCNDPATLVYGETSARAGEHKMELKQRHYGEVWGCAGNNPVFHVG